MKTPQQILSELGNPVYHSPACNCGRCKHGVETFLLPEDITEIQADARAELIPVVVTARDLHDYLHENSGTTADWPIDLVARDQRSANDLCKKLIVLRDAISRVEGFR